LELRVAQFHSHDQLFKINIHPTVIRWGPLSNIAVTEEPRFELGECLAAARRAYRYDFCRSLAIEEEEEERMIIEAARRSDHLTS
jgi:hypothetical protein